MQEILIGYQCWNDENLLKFEKKNTGWDLDNIREIGLFRNATTMKTCVVGD